MKQIKVWKDPYDAGFSICKSNKIEIQEGLTVLVGCNGSGKSTMIHNIKEVIDKEKLPCVFYDNLVDGGDKSLQNSIFHNDLSLGAALWSASEGERININLGILSSKLRNFIENGEYVKDEKYSKLLKAFEDLSGKEPEPEQEVSNERWILLDAVDSGLSIDNVIDLKGLFNIILSESTKLGISLYIVVAANEYELVNNSNCMDVTTGKYIKFKDYEDFRKFIIKSRSKKDKRPDQK